MKYFDLAAKIQKWIAKQDYFGETLLHASVCCDHVGMIRFRKAIATQIAEYFDSKESILDHLNEQYQMLEDACPNFITREQQIKLAGYRQAIIDIEEWEKHND